MIDDVSSSFTSGDFTLTEASDLTPAEKNRLSELTNGSEQDIVSYFASRSSVQEDYSDLSIATIAQLDNTQNSTPPADALLDPKTRYVVLEPFGFLNVPDENFNGKPNEYEKLTILRPLATHGPIMEFEADLAHPDTDAVLLRLSDFDDINNIVQDGGLEGYTKALQHVIDKNAERETLGLPPLILKQSNGIPDTEFDSIQDLKGQLDLQDLAGMDETNYFTEPYREEILAALPEAHRDLLNLYGQLPETHKALGNSNQITLYKLAQNTTIVGAIEDDGAPSSFNADVFHLADVAVRHQRTITRVEGGLDFTQDGVADLNVSPEDLQGSMLGRNINESGLKASDEDIKTARLVYAFLDPEIQDYAPEKFKAISNDLSEIAPDFVTNAKAATDWLASKVFTEAQVRELFNKAEEEPILGVEGEGSYYRLLVGLSEPETATGERQTLLNQDIITYSADEQGRLFFEEDGGTSAATARY